MPRVRIDEEALNNYVAAAPARQAALTDLAGQVKTSAANTIKQLQDLGVGGGSPVDSRTALTKLTSGQTLTNEDRAALNMRPTPAPAPTPAPTPAPLSAAEKAAKQTADAQAAAVKPELTDAEKKAGYSIQWVRTGVAGAGEWRKIKPGSFGTGSSGGSTGGGTGGGTGGSTGGNVSPTGGTTSVSLVSTGVDPTTGATIGYFSDGSTKTLTAGGLSKVETDAYALLEDTFRNYGLESLVSVIQEYMKKNLGAEQASLQLKQTQQYKERFAGNQIRLAAGKNVLREDAYLALENSYNETLAAYGLKGYFGPDRKTQIANIGQVIGGDVSAVEFAERVSTVVNEVKNGDPRIKGMLKAYYNIDDVDVINYYLNPSKDNLAELKRKTLSAEIGAAGAAQGLGVQKTTAEALAAQGVTQEQAIQGYKTVADVLPIGQKLSDIYGEARVGYDQATAEAETFGTTGAASAQRKRRQLAELETAAFGGRSGIDAQAGSLTRSLQGRF